MFKALKRITYKVPDLAKAKEWYSRVLDMDPVFDTPLGTVFKIGPCTMSLMPGPDPLPEESDRMGTYWEVDDVDACYRRLLEAGATSYAEVRDILSIRVARVKDPFGNIVGLCGQRPVAKRQTIENQPSATAANVAFCRALAAVDAREEIRGPDTMAELFVIDELKSRLKQESDRSSLIGTIGNRLYAYFIARTAFMDAAFRQALEENLPQIVFLGAGYDTRAYRFREKIRGARIFEVDAPATQRRKREILQKSGVSVPEQLTFVALNFKTDDVGAALEAAGFDRALKTLFIWEGVMYYLSAEDVDKTLAFVRQSSPKGSAVCFDYMTEELESINPGEPFRFWIGHEGMRGFLAQRGFRLVERLDSSEMEKRFLSLKDGSIAEKALGQFGLVKADVE